jgi:hypothetical protein
MIPGLLRYESGIEMNEQIIIMTTKGEAIALGNNIKLNSFFPIRAKCIYIVAQGNLSSSLPPPPHGPPLIPFADLLDVEPAET